MAGPADYVANGERKLAPRAGRREVGRLGHPRARAPAAAGRPRRSRHDRARLRDRLRVGLARPARRPAGRHRQLRGPARDGPPPPGRAWPRRSRSSMATPSRFRIPTAASTSRSRSTARRSGPIPTRWIPEAARLLRPAGRLIFLVNSTLLMLAMPDEERPGDRTSSSGRCAASTGSSGRTTSRSTSRSSHGDWITLLRANGFEVEALRELYPADGATTDFPYVTPEWARQWPTEEVWIARRS